MKATFNIFSSCDYFVQRWPIRGDTAWYGLERVKGKKASSWMTFKSYLKLYIIISPKKQGYGITTDTAAVHSSMHCSLENVIFSTFNLLIVNGTKERHERT